MLSWFMWSAVMKNSKVNRTTTFCRWPSLTCSLACLVSHSAWYRWEVLFKFDSILIQFLIVSHRTASWLWVMHDSSCLSADAHCCFPVFIVGGFNRQMLGDLLASDLSHHWRFDHQAYGRFLLDSRNDFRVLPSFLAGAWSLQRLVRSQCFSRIKSLVPHPCVSGSSVGDGYHNSLRFYLSNDSEAREKITQGWSSRESIDFSILVKTAPRIRCQCNRHLSAWEWSEECSYPSDDCWNFHCPLDARNNMLALHISHRKQREWRSFRNHGDFRAYQRCNRSADLRLSYEEYSKSSQKSLQLPGEA